MRLCPVLGRRSVLYRKTRGDGSSFPTGILKGVWEWDELQNAIEHGCTIMEWHESVWYRSGPLLEEFVKTLYKYRDKAHCFECGGSIGADYHCTPCDKPGYLLGLDAWAKLLLNALYGKFGQKAERLAFHYRGDPELPEGSMPLVSGTRTVALGGAYESDSRHHAADSGEGGRPSVASRSTARR